MALTRRELEKWWEERNVVGVPTLFLFVLMRTDPKAQAGAADELEFWTFLQKFFLGRSSYNWRYAS
jgi:hypothetical protein